MSQNIYTNILLLLLKQHLDFLAPCMVPISGNSHIGAPMPLPQNRFQDDTSRFNHMGLLNDSNGDANVGANDLCHLSGYYSSVSDPQYQQGNYI